MKVLPLKTPRPKLLFPFTSTFLITSTSNIMPFSVIIAMNQLAWDRKPVLKAKSAAGVSPPLATTTVSQNPTEKSNLTPAAEKQAGKQLKRRSSRVLFGKRSE